MFFKLSDIISDIQYDITSYETLGFTENYDIIYMDVSYLKGTSENFFTTIDNYIVKNKIVILRINSIPKRITEHFLNRLSKYTDINMLLPTRNSLTPYQVYLEMKLSNRILFTHGPISQNLINIMDYFYHFKSREYNKIPMRYDSVNSVNIKLN